MDGLRYGETPEAPIRNCCLQRHYGVVCPDGLVLCQLCYERFDQAELYVDPEGCKWDMCRRCGEHEEEARASK